MAKLGTTWEGLDAGTVPATVLDSIDERVRVNVVVTARAVVAKCLAYMDNDCEAWEMGRAFLAATRPQHDIPPEPAFPPGTRVVWSGTDMEPSGPLYGEVVHAYGRSALVAWEKHPMGKPDDVIPYTQLRIDRSVAFVAALAEARRDTDPVLEELAEIDNVTQHDPEITAAVAQAWCTPENEDKEMDTALAVAAVRNVLAVLRKRDPNEDHRGTAVAWENTARQYANTADWYRGLLDQIVAVVDGDPTLRAFVRTAEDGSDQGVMYSLVPEAIRRMAT